MDDDPVYNKKLMFHYRDTTGKIFAVFPFPTLCNSFLLFLDESDSDSTAEGGKQNGNVDVESLPIEEKPIQHEIDKSPSIPNVDVIEASQFMRRPKRAVHLSKLKRRGIISVDPTEVDQSAIQVDPVQPSDQVNGVANRHDDLNVIVQDESNGEISPSPPPVKLRKSKRRNELKRRSAVEEPVKRNSLVQKPLPNA